MKLWMGLAVAALLIVVPGAQSALADGGSECKGGRQAHGGGREAEHAQYRHYGHYPHHLIKHAKEIGLIPDQTARLKNIRLDFERVCLRARAEIGVSDLEIAALTDDEKAALATIEAKVKQRATAAAGLQIAAIKAKRDATALLTAEQREKDQAIHEKMMEQMRERRGGMGDSMSGGRRGGGGMGGGMGGMGGGQMGGGRRGGGGMGGGQMGGGGMRHGGGGMGGGMMQGDGQMGGGMMDDDMMQDRQDDSSQQEESQGEHQNH